MKARIHFANDPSVGIFSEDFEMELPFQEFADDAHRAEVRKQIEQLYSDLNGEFLVSYVDFSDEKDEEFDLDEETLAEIAFHKQHPELNP